MSKELTNPLQALINKANTSLPARTGAVEPYYERLRRIHKGHTVILADVSGSMASPAWGGRTKHAVLGEAIAASMQQGHHELVAFSGDARFLMTAGTLPPPGGSTAMHIGLQVAIQRGPGRILVVSDGEPDDERTALEVAASFVGVIDVLYIGPDANVAAMNFLRRLAKAGHGRYQGSDIGRAGQPALAQTMRQLLLEA